MGSAPGQSREARDGAGNAGFSAAAPEAGRPLLGDVVLLPVPELFGSEVAVFFHIKMFGFILKAAINVTPCTMRCLCFGGSLWLPLTFNLDGETFSSTFSAA